MIAEEIIINAITANDEETQREPYPSSLIPGSQKITSKIVIRIIILIICIIVAISNKLIKITLRKRSKVVDDLEVGEPLRVEQVLVLLLVVVGPKQPVRCYQFFADLRALSQVSLERVFAQRHFKTQFQLKVVDFEFSFQFQLQLKI